MPANLTAQFIKARDKFRAASDPAAKLAALEEMLATIPKHKGTDKMQADIKRRIAKLRESQGSSKKGRGAGYDHIPKEGAGQVALVGAPNSGKSALLGHLTNAKPEIAEYPFSTIVPVPGMMTFEDISIQLIDLPPVTAEYTEGWVYSLIRAADLVLITLDATEAELAEDYLEEILSLVEQRHVELVHARVQTDDERVRQVPCRSVITKADRVDESEIRSLTESLPYAAIATDVESAESLDGFRRMVFDALEILRIYTKLPGKKPDMTEPYTLPIGSTVLDAVRLVHREFVDRLKYVRIWGSGRFDGQQVPSDHLLADGDIVEIHIH